MDERTSREQRNINVLKLKSQDIKTRYASGKVRVDVPGTEQEMTSNTILAVPTRLIAREGVTPAKSIKINNYTQAGESGKLIRSTTVGLQRNMVDLDEAMDFTLSTDGDKLKPTNNKTKKKQNPVETADSDFGRAVTKPARAKATDEKIDLVKVARALLGK